jgi:hypothetical protein
VGNNTCQVVLEDGTTQWILHATPVVTQHPDGTYTLNTGGWKTPTTKDRINLYAPVNVVQKKHQWYIGEHLFYDGIRVSATGEILSEKKTPQKATDKMLKRIDTYVKHLTKEKVAVPSSGDCWYCLMKTQEGETMGDFSNDHSHLLSHMSERYYPGALLVNAMREAGYRDDQLGVFYHMDMIETFQRSLRKYLIKRLVK